MVSFDELLREINEYGSYQKLRYFLICIAGMLPSIVTYIHSFTAANPDHRCKNPYDINDLYSIKNYTNINITLNKCNYKLSNETLYNCKEWVYDKTYYESTLTEEWSMVCDTAVRRGTLQTIYFSGYLVGSLILGLLADMLGRKPIMITGFILIIIGGFGSAFGPQQSIGVTSSYSLYALFRFLTAAGTRGVNVIGFVLALEIVGKSYRTFAGIIVEIYFAVGQLLLVLIAYLIRDWRTLAWVVAIIPCIPFVPFSYLIEESPSWLISKNRKNDAYKILKKIANKNKRELSDDLWNNFLKNDQEKQMTQSESLLAILKSPVLLIITLSLFLNWIVNNFVFYGIGLISNDLGLNPYLTFSISALVELLAYIVTYFLVDKVGRKYPYFGFLLFSGISLLVSVFLENNIASVTFAMISKFCVSSSYAILFVYTTELFPTSVRSSCVGACSMMARVGSMIAPLILSLGDTTSKKMPLLIFSICAIISAINSLIFPETLKRNMPQTIDEAEKLNSIKCIKNRVSDEVEIDSINMIKK